MPGVPEKDTFSIKALNLRAYVIESSNLLLTRGKASLINTSVLKETCSINQSNLVQFQNLTDFQQIVSGFVILEYVMNAVNFLSAGPYHVQVSN